MRWRGPGTPELIQETLPLLAAAGRPCAARR